MTAQDYQIARDLAESREQVGTLKALVKMQSLKIDQLDQQVKRQRDWIEFHNQNHKCVVISH